ncbi:hypothetical protein DENSPDRAFT_256681 [Dentipellis sp. KUC8613]|nr:hypothetical protein DENSPDRAFT_256681 [Dentipellis sp. KUC8613]
MLLKNVPIKRGIAFLEPSNIELKGHQTEDRDVHRDRDFVRSLRVRMHGLAALEDEPDDDVPANDNNPGAAPPNPAPNRAPAQAPAPAQVPAPAPERARTAPARRTPAAQLPPEPRSPLRELSHSPPPPMGHSHDDDGPRRRRIPSQPPTSTGTTLVQSSYFSGTTAAGSSTASSSGLQARRMLSPTRTAAPDMLVDTDEDEAPPSTQVKVEAPMGSAARPIPIEPSSQWIFDDALEDPAFLAGLDEVMASQDTSVDATSQGRDVPSAGGSRPPNAQVPPLRRLPSDVIEIEDDDDDKENAPVPTRRVRPRVARTTFDDDVIDLSDL